jgi:hypothetical protein
MKNVCILYEHFGILKAIWYILVFLECSTKKNLASLVPTVPFSLKFMIG